MDFFLRLRKAIYRLRRKNGWMRKISIKDILRIKRLLNSNNYFLKQYLQDARQIFDEKYTFSRNPLVSVVIPTYNLGEILVERAVKSVQTQTYADWELIIYGDVCADNTEELIKKLNDPRIVFQNLKNKLTLYQDPKINRLFSSGWKPYINAINDAKGEWICLLNDDDEFTPNHIELLVDRAKKTNAEFIYGMQKNIYDDEKERVIGKEGFPDGKLPYFMSCVPQRTVMFRSYLKPFLFTRFTFIPDKKIGGDMLWWEQMGMAGVRAAYLDKVVAYKHHGVQRKA